MAKKPARALTGGGACFREDGSFTKSVCQALQLTQQKFATVCSKIQTRTSDRDAWKQEIPKMKAKSPERQARSEQFTNALFDLEQLRKEKTKLGSLFSQIVKGANENEFSATMTAEEIVEAAQSGKDPDPADAEEGDDDEGEEPDQLKIQGSEQVRPDSLFSDWAKAYPAFFGDRELGAIKPHLDKLFDPDRCSPWKLGRWLAEQFGIHKKSKDRQELLEGPPWFKDGLFACLALACTGETCKGEVGGEEAAAQLLGWMGVCASKDIEAWLNISGGKDGPANKALLKAS